ncbi:MAG: hypothetical protein CL693_08210 [Cellvibrionaceae bacterium]|nr:hypothetical protein [Cellvibrionaceae bacterium]|tara:strand:+ start:28833 stop:29756 length:924 start_codon:yes stop_codon:yes gene_type:complete
MSRINAYILLAVWLCLTASSFVVAEVVAPYANPIATTALRFWLATALLLPFVKRHHLKHSSLEVLLKYVLVSSLLVGFFVGLFVALKSTTAVKTSVIYTSTPLLSVVLSFLLLKVKPSWIQFLGFVLGCVGALWLLFSSNRGLVDGWSWTLGDGIFLLACFSMGLHIVLLKVWFFEVPPVQSVFHILLIGSLLLTPPLMIWGQPEDVQWLQAEFWWSLIYLTAFATVGTFMLQQNILQRLSANHLLSASYLSPAVVMLLSVSMTSTQWRGDWQAMLLTLLAVGLIFHRHEAPSTEIVTSCEDNKLEV